MGETPKEREEREEREREEREREKRKPREVFFGVCRRVGCGVQLLADGTCPRCQPKVLR
jgi:hypothetical protein